MQAIQNVFRWSMYVAVIAAIMAAGTIVAFWAAIEFLAFLIGMSS